MSGFKFTFLVFSFFILSGLTLGQTNSVLLKNGNGTLISSHASINAAYSSIPAAISQAYIIELLADYNTSAEVFPIEINARTGSSSENTITLRPAAGNYGVVISRALNNNPIINLNGVNYFVLDGRPGGIGDSASMIIENTLNVGAKTNTINFIDGASNNVVKYVVAKSIPRSNAGPRNIAFASSNNGSCVNNLIDNCTVSGGRSGISFSGISSGINSGNIIRNTKVYNFGLTGFWLIGSTENTSIQGCEIYQGESGLNTSIVGGILLNPSGTRGINEISNNKIYNLRHNSYLDSAGVWGILGSGANGSTLNIFNNFIALPDDNQNTNSTHGIFLNDSTAFTANVFYNTVRVGGVQAGSISEVQILSSAITKTNSNELSVFNIYNNIFINSRTGGTGYHVAGHFANTNGNLTIDYNCYYSESASPVFHTVWGTSLFNILPDYRNAAFPNEQHSIFKDVQFVSATDLHVTGTSNGDIELAGMPTGITFDFDFDVRDNVYPYKGADEADLLPVELSTFTASVSGNTVTLAWITATEVNNSGFEVQRRNEENSWTSVTFVSGSGTSASENRYAYADKDLATGKYFYRLKQIDFGGAYTYYNLEGAVEISNPQVYSLSQNYPNPFNPSTVIEYSIPTEGLVTLKIYSVTGEVVALLVNDVKAAGNHKFDFNASSLASGTYIYTLKVNDYVSTKKMVLIR